MLHFVSLQGLSVPDCLLQTQRTLRILHSSLTQPIILPALPSYTQSLLLSNFGESPSDPTPCLGAQDLEALETMPPYLKSLTWLTGCIEGL